MRYEDHDLIEHVDILLLIALVFAILLWIAWRWV
jgi:hypothetical protein